MTKEELLTQLAEVNENGDTEMDHMDADCLLLTYINDPDITDAYNRIPKWYA